MLKRLHAWLLQSRPPRVLAAMDAHRGDTDVQQWGCIALQNVIGRNAAAKAQIAAGGLTQIVSMMDLHGYHAGVQLAACQLLLNLSASMDLRGGIKAAGAGDISLRNEK